MIEIIHFIFFGLTLLGIMVFSLLASYLPYRILCESPKKGKKLNNVKKILLTGICAWIVIILMGVLIVFILEEGSYFIFVMSIFIGFLFGVTGIIQLFFAQFLRAKAYDWQAKMNKPLDIENE